MTALNKGVTVIDPDEIFSFNVGYLLMNSRMRNVVIINTHELSSKYDDIAHIMSIEDCLKMFYGCDENFYKEMIDTFKIIKGKVLYLGRRLVIPEVISYYWKNKGFQQFDPTVMLGRHGLETL